MAEKPKRRPGRPKKNVLEQQAQFSIRLPLRRRLELEVIARSHNESLSQAAERAIEVASKVIEVSTEENKSVSDAVGAGLAGAAHFFRNKQGYSHSLEDISELIEKNPGAYRVFALPDSLKKPDEEFFIEIMNAIASDVDSDGVTTDLAKAGDLDLVLDACLQATRVGFRAEDLIHASSVEERANLAKEWVYDLISANK